MSPAPIELLDGRAGDPSRRQLPDQGLDLLAEEEQLVAPAAGGGMNGYLRRRQPEDQPAVTGVHVGEPEDIPKERAIGGGILRIENAVCPVDHAADPSARPTMVP